MSVSSGMLTLLVETRELAVEDSLPGCVLCDDVVFVAKLTEVKVSAMDDHSSLL